MMQTFANTLDRAWEVDPRVIVDRAARAMTWVREAGGPNKGPAVEAIQRRVRLKAGDPWCAAFVGYIGWSVFRGEWPIALVGGCASLAQDAVAKGLIRRLPAPGAIFLLWGKNRYNHTGFVGDQITDDLWDTVEGNTSPTGSPEGTGVFVRQRAFKLAGGTYPSPGFDAFIHWWEDRAS